MEHHPAIVVDGPLQGDWLTQTVLNWLGEDGALVELEYANRRTGYLGETLISGGKIEAVRPESFGAPTAAGRRVAGLTVAIGKLVLMTGRKAPVRARRGKQVVENLWRTPIAAT